MRILGFHGRTDQPLGTIEEYGLVTADYDLNGMTAAEVGMPHWYAHELGTAGFWLAGGIGPTLQIDARDIIPWVCPTGRVGVPNVDEAHTAVQVALTSRGGQLDRFSTEAGYVMSGPAGLVAAAIVGGNGQNLRVEPGYIAYGRQAALTLSGGSVRAALNDLAAQTAEEWSITDVPGSPVGRFNWRSPISDSRRQYGRVCLIEDVNCTIQPAYNLEYAVDELTAVAFSLYHAQGSNGERYKAPFGTVVGREAALGALINSGTAWGMTEGGGEVQARPDIVGFSALAAMAEGQLRDLLTVPLDIVVTMTNFDQLADMMPGDLVSVRYPSDFVGVWRRAIGRIIGMSLQLFPILRCKLNVQIWRTEVGTAVSLQDYMSVPGAWRDILALSGVWL